MRMEWRSGGVWAAVAPRALRAARVGAVLHAGELRLFVYVFGAIGQHPATKATPTASIATPTPTFSKQGQPTATPGLVQIPTFTQPVPAAQAWRGFKPTVSLTFKPNGTVEFIPNIFSSDLTAVGGVLFDTSGSFTAHPAYYTIATGTITTLSPTWHGNASPAGSMLAMDSRFIVYSFYGGCGECGSSVWSLDRTSGKIWNINQNIGGDVQEDVSNDHAEFATAQGQVWVADFAAHTVRVALPIGSKPYSPTSQRSANERVLGLQWPYLLYEESPLESGVPAVTTLNVLDLATGVNTRVHLTANDQNGAQVDPTLDGVMSMALVGKTLYAIAATRLSGVDAHGNAVDLTYGTLYRMADFTAGGKFVAVALWPFPGPNSLSYTDPPTMATRHLIWLGSGYFWDNAQSRLVSTDLTYVELIGSDIVTTDAYSDAAALQAFHAYGYDTTNFPVPPGW